jgi:protein-S-isoprenylcysteine O-methyltransferase Ste14
LSRLEWTRVGILYFPITAALIAGLVNRGLRRQLASCLLSLLWAAPALLFVQQLNQHEGWWHFAASTYAIESMPLEAFLGWTVFWGILPQLVFRRLPLGLSAAALIAADLVLMPLCTPLIELEPNWLIGELAAAFIVLVPALCIGRWTFEQSHLRFRVVMQISISALLFLYLIPEITFALRGGIGWAPLLQQPGWQLQLSLQGLFMIAVPGISAVFDFAERGNGTPIPYDPPSRMVTTGMYRYCANPMQMSCTAVVFVWALLLRSQWLLLAAAISGIYSAGIAEWDERQDLLQRFGVEWRNYRKEVRNWRFRWKPYHAGASARLFIASTCGPCRAIGNWLEHRRPIGLDLIAAESLPAGSIRRLGYDPGDGTPAVEGVRALGRALEHLNLGWAYAGAILRLPIMWRFIQLVMDVSGFGPRELRGIAKCSPQATLEPARTRFRFPPS